MRSESLCSPAFFYDLCQHEPSLWNTLLGRYVLHRNKGLCRVKSVDYTAGKAEEWNLLLKADENLPRERGSRNFFCAPSAFEGGDILQADFTEEVLEKMLLRIEKEIRTGYAIPDSFPFLPEKPPFSYLLELRTKGTLHPYCMKWLKRKELFQAAALCYEKITSASGQFASSASSCWRSALKPERALIVTASAASFDTRYQSSAFCSRGGAFKDIWQKSGSVSDLDQAEACGLRAIKTATSKTAHPYNLLAAVYYYKRDGRKCAEYSQKAFELGSVQRAFFKSHLLVDMRTASAL